METLYESILKIYKNEKRGDVLELIKIIKILEKRVESLREEIRNDNRRWERSQSIYKK